MSSELQATIPSLCFKQVILCILLHLPVKFLNDGFGGILHVNKILGIELIKFMKIDAQETQSKTELGVLYYFGDSGLE